MPTGSFFVVVGASGVGKDTLIAGAMEILAPTGRYVQARRVITRPAGPGEDHTPVSPDEFERLEAAGVTTILTSAWIAKERHRPSRHEAIDLVSEYGERYIAPLAGS
mgnify:CR=1 FL=1